MSNEWVIWIFEGITLLTAIILLFSRSVFYSGLYLLVIVLSIGVLFGLYGSEFFFISQIMIYGGGILVLILFATMVTTSKKSGVTQSKSIPISLMLIVTAIIVLLIVYVMAYQPLGIPYVVTTATLGKVLLSDYSLPLELAGYLLLVSLIGSAITAIQKPKKP